jgi:dTDP-4-dehydrorhamnose reductase
VYGKTKLAGEQFAQEHPHHMIIRTSWLYGPGGPNFIKTIAQAAREGKPLRVVHDQIGSPTYTRDLARAIADMLRIHFRGRALERAYHLTGKGYCSWYELACAITQTLGLTAQIIPVASSEFPRKAQRPKNSRLSNERFHALTGRYLPAWQDALRDYLKGTL